MLRGETVLRSGKHFMDGNEACAEGAIAAGCRFVSGYPITPSTEIVEHLSRRFPEIGGMFLQMEDELSASICFQGAVWAGVKGMTVTSGPGFSLMMEHIGFAAMTETPSVFVNVQRAGPSTGLPTAPAQQDVMQARWGSHGDYGIIALSPASPQECHDLIITCFNYAETYRCPVLFMMDETVGHMHGKVTIPSMEDIHVVERRISTRSPSDYAPFRVVEGDVPEMTRAGAGHRIHMTGLTHDERGYPDMTTAAQESLVRRLCGKVNNHVKEISMMESRHVEGSDVVVISYGISAQIAGHAVDAVRAAGIRAGQVRLISLWPFDDEAIRNIARSTRHIIVLEMNLGQMVREVERAVRGIVPVHAVGNAGGRVIAPDCVVEKIREVLR